MKKYFNIKNETGLKIPFNKWIKEIKEDIKKVSKDNYPINVVVSNSEYENESEHYEHSKFIFEDNLMHIKVIPDSTLRQIKWSFMHEFRHFMQKHVPELNMTTHNREDIVALKKLIDRIKELDDKEFYETFHDILPMEADSIVYATERAGANFRKHPLKDTIPQYIGESKKIKMSDKEKFHYKLMTRYPQIKQVIDIWRSGPDDLFGQDYNNHFKELLEKKGFIMIEKGPYKFEDGDIILTSEDDPGDLCFIFIEDKIYKIYMEKHVTPLDYDDKKHFKLYVKDNMLQIVRKEK